MSAMDHMLLREDVKMSIDITVKRFIQSSPESEYQSISPVSTDGTQPLDFKLHRSIR